MINEKEYLGDGAYVRFDGYQVVLTAENGISVTDSVFLEPEVLGNFLEYIDRLKAFVEHVTKSAQLTKEKECT